MEITTQRKAFALHRALNPKGRGCTERGWRNFYHRIVASADAQYGNHADGDPVVFAARNDKPARHGTPQLIGYRWLPPALKASGNLLQGPMSTTWTLGQWTVRSDDWTEMSHRPRAVIVHIHGLGDHARCELLKLGYNEAGEPQADVRDSYLEALLGAGLAVYAMDLQGHGLSQGWRGSRNNTPSFEAIEENVSKWLTNWSLIDSWDRDGHKTPVFISGLSMGGYLALKLAGRWPLSWPAEALILLAPVCAIGSVKEERWYYSLLKLVGGAVATAFPFMPVAKLPYHGRFKEVKERLTQDPLVMGSCVQARMLWTLYTATRSGANSWNKRPAAKQIIAFQSLEDSLCDPAVTQAVLEKMEADHGVPVKWCPLGKEDSWHLLLQEPCASKMVRDIASYVQDILEPTSCLPRNANEPKPSEGQ